MMRFKIFNTVVTVSYAFLLIVCVLLLLDRTGYAGLSVLTVFLHEMGHYAAMRMVKAPILQVDFCVCTVRVTTAPVLSVRQTAVIAFFGPFVNLLLSLFVFVDHPLALYFGAANLGFGLMNLIPAKGLDGGDLIFCILSKLFPKKAAVIFSVTSIFSVSLIIFLGGVFLAFSKYNPTLLLVGIYLLILHFRKV